MKQGAVDDHNENHHHQHHDSNSDSDLVGTGLARNHAIQPSVEAFLPLPPPCPLVASGSLGAPPCILLPSSLTSARRRVASTVVHSSDYYNDNHHHQHQQQINHNHHEGQVHFSTSPLVVRHLLRNSYYDKDNNCIMSSNITQGVPPNRQIPKFAFAELTLGRVVGQGGFSTVTEISSIDLIDMYDTDETETAIRKDLAAQANRRGLNEGTSRKFVLKTLRHDLPEEEKQKGIVDLAIEAEFLSVLKHPNIIAMRGVANTDPNLPKFFVILDRLTQTLDRKFNYWRKCVGENAGYWLGPCFGYCCANSHALHNLWRERLTVSLDIAKAMQYLHSQNIVYRDLKPDNIGFDADGRLKLFDFGLAKRLQGAEKLGTGLYNLTGNTGSLRYMAPEVANDLPYDQTVDAYSFGIIFWQICALQTPYAGYSQKMHADKVVRQGQRPKPDGTWPYSWVDLMQMCWSPDRDVRPPFKAIVNVLQEKLDEMAQDEGVIPSRASEIRAKKSKKKVAEDGARLDLDTRISSDKDQGVKRFETDIV